jgi:hypothetical protein
MYTTVVPVIGCNCCYSDLAEAVDCQVCQSVSQLGICWLEHLVLLEHWRNPFRQCSHFGKKYHLIAKVLPSCWLPAVQPECLAGSGTTI